jgi:hypothetical protein
MKAWGLSRLNKSLGYRLVEQEFGVEARELGVEATKLGVQTLVCLVNFTSLQVCKITKLQDIKLQSYKLKNCKIIICMCSFVNFKFINL